MQKRKAERGSHHLVLIVGIVVALIGILGFVGYNAWQRQTSNAGGQNTVGSTTQIKAAEKKITNLESQLTQAQATYKKKVELADAAQKRYFAHRNAQMKADPAIDKKFKAKWAADKVYAAKRDALKKQIAALKKNGVSAKERKTIKSLEAKIASAKKVHQKAEAPAVAVREKWPTYQAYVAAQKQVSRAEQKVNDLKADIRKAKNHLSDLKKKKSEDKTPVVVKRHACATGQIGTFTSTARGCYPTSIVWDSPQKESTCPTISQSHYHYTISCAQRGKQYFTKTTGSGIGYSSKCRSKQITRAQASAPTVKYTAAKACS
ncbi:MAG TPA: hypothetical protein VGE34_03740 [Candidatus Saccharimonadales bacterium]